MMCSFAYVDDTLFFVVLWMSIMRDTMRNVHTTSYDVILDGFLCILDMIGFNQLDFAHQMGM